MSPRWSVITTTDAPWSVIAPRIAEHRAYQDELLARGVLIASGPFLADDDEPTGAGLAIIAAASRAEAERIAGADPLVRDGLRRVAVHRWRINQLALDQLSTGEGYAR